MTTHAFASYDAFTARAFGGSQAAVVTDAGSIGPAKRQIVARELCLPATAFVDACGDDWIQAQFYSPVMELPMCGHGTLCLLTHLFESGVFTLARSRHRTFELRLPAAVAVVEVTRRGDDRYRVMLDIEPPKFEPPPPHIGELLYTLGLDAGALDTELACETARGDFSHLVLPLAGLDTMSRIEPDFNAMIGFCRAHGIDTIAAFCREVEDPDCSIHVRDFCPAVGVAESAAAGTTNAALAAYLLRHELVAAENGMLDIFAEQGLELGRSSSIQSRIDYSDGKIGRLQVGGVASKIIDGQIYV